MRRGGSQACAGLSEFWVVSRWPDQLVDALKRLEYRGYDSAGVATLEKRRADPPPRRRQAAQPGAAGSQDEPLAGTVGIGHTRWATHGKPTENNAHPHATDRLAVVHNGIIENFRELREELEAKGAQFGSETDTEVVAHLVTDEMKKGLEAGGGGEGGAAAAARRVRARLPVRRRGGSADRRAQGLAARDRLRRRRDVSGLRRDRARAVHRHHQLSRGRRLGGVVRARASQVRDGSGRPVERAVLKSNASAFLVDKGNHKHFMAKEIHEQPEVVGHTLAHYLDMGAERVRLPVELPFDLTKVERLSISACGTAYYAGLVAKYWFERFARLAGRNRRRVRVPLSRGAAARRAIWRCSSRSPGKPPTRWPRCATRASRSSTSCRWSTSRPRPSRAKATW